MSFLLFIVAAVAGALNSVAGGGSFLTLPTLLYAGITPVVANATSTMAMLPGSVASAVAYRRELQGRAGWLVPLGIVSLIGGWLGAVLLVRTSDTRFMRLLPWLMLLAAVTFTFGDRVRRTLSLEQLQGHLWLIAAVQFVISIYGGYFGGGMGIMMLASFALGGMLDIHEMNGLKTFLGVAVNLLALAEFIVKGLVAWVPGLIMVAGAICGGYFGAVLARRVDPKWVRAFVIVIGWTMTIYFFVK
ncbi:MAG TPA: sulfite exporter TauE/SafE family protein [Vicinamibacterales bacterium]